MAHCATDTLRPAADYSDRRAVEVPPKQPLLSLGRLLGSVLAVVGIRDRLLGIDSQRRGRYEPPLPSAGTYN